MSPRRLGQHFLADAGWRARILNTLRIKPEDAWLEIGAGHGEMTQELARTARRVIAVEVDAPLVEKLRELARELPNIEVVAEDILQLDLARVLSEGSFKVYGNLPYYITSPILRHLFEYAERIGEIHIVVQFEVAARLVARPHRREYGYLSALAQFYTRPEIVLRIPPGAFRPRPKVTSALVSMNLPGERAKLEVENEKRFLKFLQACFAQKRKTLVNNLRGLAPAERVEAALSSMGLSARARAEELSLAQFAQLYGQTAR